MCIRDRHKAVLAGYVPCDPRKSAIKIKRLL
jgi:hypothetical protein